MCFRVKLAAVALGGLLLAGATASADPVTFKTDFDFNPSAAGIQHTLQLADGASLTLAGLPATIANTGTDVGFGTITFDPKDSRGTLSIDQDFVLMVTLLDPTTGSGTTTANFFGSINTRSTTGSITLLGGSVDISGYTFTLQDTDVSLFKGVIESQVLLGNITVAPATAHAVPVPAAAYGGASLLGLLGGARVWRRRRLSE
jgi:hypothetical protein